MACRKTKAEEVELGKENEGEDVYYCREAHGKENKEYFETETRGKEDYAPVFVNGHKIYHVGKTTQVYRWNSSELEKDPRWN